MLFCYESVYCESGTSVFEDLFLINLHVSPEIHKPLITGGLPMSN